MRRTKAPRIPPLSSPFPLEEAVPVGGFLMTMRLEDPSLFSRAVQGYEGMPVHVHTNKPVVLLLTVQNTTDRVLRYAVSGADQTEYQVEVRGGSRHRARSEEGKGGGEIPVKDILHIRTPFTAYGASLYERSILPSALLLASQPPPEQLKLWTIGYYTPYASRKSAEIEPGGADVFRIAVDFIYDLSVSGLYRMSVRHLFPVQQLGEGDGTAWETYCRMASHYAVVPGACEVAVSNAIDVLVLRDAVSHVFHAE